MSLIRGNILKTLILPRLEKYLNTKKGGGGERKANIEYKWKTSALARLYLESVIVYP